MRKSIVGFAIAAVLITVPLAASAQSVDVQGQISALLAQIKVLQQQLTDLLKQQAAPVALTPASAPTWPNKDRICSLVNRNLAIGTRGDDVSALQDFLSNQGHFSGESTGFFGEVTSQALARWQNAQGFEGVGNLGPLSRARILKWCGGDTGSNNFEASPQSGSAPLSVSFVYRGLEENGQYWIDYGDGAGELMGTEQIYCIKAPCISPSKVTHTYTNNGTYTAAVSRYIACLHSNPRCMVMQPAPLASLVIKVGSGPVACTMDYTPVCGSKQVVCIKAPCNPVQQTYGNRCGMNADGATYLYEGECRDNPMCPAIAYPVPQCGAGEKAIPVDSTAQCPGPMKCVPDPSKDPKCKKWDDGQWCGQTCYRSTPGGETACMIPSCAQPTSPIPPARAPQCLEYINETQNPAADPTCRAWFDGCNTCSRSTPDGAVMCTLMACVRSSNEPAPIQYCKERFDGGSTNRPPVVSGIAGPTSLRVNTSGTWSVSASDPENGALSYRIMWGDEYSSPWMSVQSSSLSGLFFQTSTFTHTYSLPGTYTVSVVAKDIAGATASASVTVNVVSDSGGASYVCPADARLCPNGTYVGRTGPNCEFACPISPASASTNYSGSNTSATSGGAQGI